MANSGPAGSDRQSKPQDPSKSMDPRSTKIDRPRTHSPRSLHEAQNPMGDPIRISVSKRFLSQARKSTSARKVDERKPPPDFRSRKQTALATFCKAAKSTIAYPFPKPSKEEYKRTKSRREKTPAEIGRQQTARLFRNFF